MSVLPCKFIAGRVCLHEHHTTDMLKTWDHEKKRRGVLLSIPGTWYMRTIVEKKLRGVTGTRHNTYYWCKIYCLKANIAQSGACCTAAAATGCFKLIAPTSFRVQQCPRRFWEIRHWNFARVFYAPGEPLTSGVFFFSFFFPLDICVFVFFGVFSVLKGSHICGEKRNEHIR